MPGTPPPPRLSLTSYYVRWHRILKFVMLIWGGWGGPSPKVRTFCNRGGRSRVPAQRWPVSYPSPKVRTFCNRGGRSRVPAQKFGLFVTEAAGHRKCDNEKNQLSQQQRKHVINMFRLKLESIHPEKWSLILLSHWILTRINTLKPVEVSGMFSGQGSTQGNALSGEPRKSGSQKGIQASEVVLEGFSQAPSFAFVGSRTNLGRNWYFGHGRH